MNMASQQQKLVPWGEKCCAVGQAMFSGPLALESSVFDFSAFAFLGQKLCAPHTHSYDLHQSFSKCGPRTTGVPPVPRNGPRWQKVNYCEISNIQLRTKRTQSPGSIPHIDCNSRETVFSSF